MERTHLPWWSESGWTEAIISLGCWDLRYYNKRWGQTKHGLVSKLKIKRGQITTNLWAADSRQLYLASLICLKSCDPILIPDLDVCSSVCNIISYLHYQSQRSRLVIQILHSFLFENLIKNSQTGPKQLLTNSLMYQNIFLCHNWM